MIDPTINAAVVTFAGAFIGGVTFVAAALNPAYEHGRPPEPPPLFKSGYFKALREQQNAEEAAWDLAPRSYKLALAAFGGVIVVVALGIYLSVVHMRWPFFIAGYFAGFLALNGVYVLTLSGKITIRTPAFLDRLSGAPREADRRNTGVTTAGT
jgi:hypothetical protein